ncbi:uncharacterized protein LOC113319210 isoform X1 [Papaver somniferum]|uniref:uncharacterized protein LOC113319210 isoform X1 n=2 Tax=Papaver somniferum TaxID=3469 RepID=UPI000E704BE6|nr:uncharacterized protein LOC113319210 isoform X1 [Papaver somniferum]XP_026423266.1 uncharacterized protein LOC113319210 isoform X1 [Papaver somniferum]XP_026423267.1 uncharacterized protein LOC113319210 isoform X1 [Papaver somniferum]
MQIHQLAVNSLLRSNQINEMEGGALFVFDLCIFESHAKTGFHEASAFASAFGMQSKLHDPAPFCTGYYTRRLSFSSWVSLGDILTPINQSLQYFACGLDTLVESKGFLESFSEEPALVQLHLLTVTIKFL